VKVDPATMELTEVKLPNPATTSRRLDIAADGLIWYVNSSQGKLGRYNPKAVPSGGVHAGIVRHMRTSNDGNLLIEQTATNRIIQVNIQRRAASR
jgi:virginiamycin B lyase